MSDDEPAITFLSLGTTDHHACGCYRKEAVVPSPSLIVRTCPSHFVVVGMGRNEPEPRTRIGRWLRWRRFTIARRIIRRRMSRL